MLAKRVWTRQHRGPRLNRYDGVPVPVGAERDPVPDRNRCRSRDRALNRLVLRLDVARFGPEPDDQSIAVRADSRRFPILLDQDLKYKVVERLGSPGGFILLRLSASLLKLSHGRSPL